MPLLLRTVDPSHVSRGCLPDRFKVQNDLEAVANGTLANVIRQLSSLSHHAEELFTDLISVGTEIAHRASNLQARIDRLAVRVGHIDSVQEESASIHESLNTKPFTSSMTFDQQVVSRHTLPPAMSKTFLLCDKPPPLDKLNKYRDDGRDGLKFYTDPSYFFDLWRQEMLKDTERAIDRGKKPHKPKQDGQNRHKKRVRQPHNTRERQRHLAIEQGEHIMPLSGNDFRNTHNNTDMESHDGSFSYPTPPPADSRGSYGNGRPNNVEYEENSQVDYNHTANLHQHQQQQQYEAYQRYYASQNQNQNYESPNNYRSSRNTTPGVNGYRPSQPPPAPPPSYLVGSPGAAAGSPHSLSNSMGMNHNNNANNNVRTPTGRPSHRETLPPPPPPPTESTVNGIYPPPPPEEEPLPPPPPTPMEHSSLRPPTLPEEHLPPSPPPPPPMDDISNSQAPPPPPPPPPGVTQGQGQPTPLANGLKKARPNHTPVVRDGRDELLKAIRDGIALRKVEATNESKVEEKPSTFHDVASILARRVAVEMSDSDSGSSEYDSDAWDEASA